MAELTHGLHELRELAKAYAGAPLPAVFLIGVQRLGGSSLDDIFDDAVGIVKPDSAYFFKGTTNPGRYYTQHPEELGNAGVAFLPFGWHADLWEIGTFKRSVERLKHEAFISRRLADVIRDTNKNGIVDAADIEAKAEGICGHWSWGGSNIGKSSAGCFNWCNLADLNFCLNLARASGQETFSVLHIPQNEFPDALTII